MFEILRIPYGYLKFVVHVINLGLGECRTTGFETEHKWLSDWCDAQVKDLEIPE